MCMMVQEYVCMVVQGINTCVYDGPRIRVCMVDHGINMCVYSGPRK